MNTDEIKTVTVEPTIVSDDYIQDPPISSNPEDLPVNDHSNIIIEFPEEQLYFVRRMLDSGKEIPIVQNEKRPDGERFKIGQKFMTKWGDIIQLTNVVYCIVPTQLPTWRSMNPDERENILLSISKNGIANLCWMTFKKFINN